MAVSNEQKMLKERMRALLSTKRKTASDLGETDNEKKIYQRQIHQDSLITFDTIYKVLYMFPDIDANWLVLGEGGMTRTEHLAPRVYNQQRTEVHDHATNTNNFGASTIPHPVQALLEEKDKRIAELEKINQTLQTLVNAFTAGLKK